MKTLPILLGLSCTALLFTACEYDDDDYHRRSVSVSTGGYYGGDYDEYSPYYSYSNRRYYRTGNRYVYYTNSRPYYVTALPSGANYITPRRTSTYRSGTSVRTYRQEPTVSRYETTSDRRVYDTRSDRERQVYTTDRRDYDSGGVRVQTTVPSSRVIRRDESSTGVRIQSNQVIDDDDDRRVRRVIRRDD